MKTKALYFILLISIFLSCSKKEISYGDAFFTIVNDYNNPIPNAKIVFMGRQFTSNDLGEYFMKNIPVGEYNIKVSKDNYLDFTTTFSVRENEQSKLLCVLKEGDAYLKLDEFSFETYDMIGEKTISIESNTLWKFSDIPDGVKISKVEGGGNDIISIRWNFESYNSDARVVEKKFKITASNISQTITLKYFLPLKVVNVKGYYGNSEEGKVNYGRIFFNDPVDIEDVYSGFLSSI